MLTRSESFACIARSRPLVVEPGNGPPIIRRAAIRGSQTLIHLVVKDRDTNESAGYRREPPRRNPAWAESDAGDHNSGHRKQQAKIAERAECGVERFLSFHEMFKTGCIGFAGRQEFSLRW